LLLIPGSYGIPYSLLIRMLSFFSFRILVYFASSRFDSCRFVALRNISFRFVAFRFRLVVL
jgi:hypothetical protein